MDTQIDGPDEVGNFSIREGEHRRVLSPGRIVHGTWVDTDLSDEPTAIRDAAAEASDREPPGAEEFIAELPPLEWPT